MHRSFFAPLICCSLILAQPQYLFAEEVQMDQKLERYHSILKKRPNSAALFQTFQTHWLAQHDSESLETFLQTSAQNGGAADQQIYGYYLLQKGQDKEALDAFGAALESEPENAQAWIEKARCYAKLLDFDRALTDIEQAIKHSDNDELRLDANKLKGRFLIRSGETDKASAHWAKLAADNKEDTDLIEDVIDIQLSDGLNDAALKLAAELRDQTRDPYKKALRTLRVGDILQKTGQRQESIDTYLGALESSGNGSWLEREIIAQLEKVYKKDDDIAGLVKTLQSLHTQYSQRVYIHKKYADQLASQGEFEKAESIYKDLLKKSPANQPLRLAYLGLLKKSSNYKDASKFLDFLIEQNPNDPQLLLQKASIADEMEDRAMLLEALNQYSAKSAKTPATALNFAKLLTKYRFNEEATAAYQSARAAFPESMEIAFAAANFLLRQDQKDAAIEIWKSIAETAPKDTVIRLLETLIANNQLKLAMEVTTTHYEKNKSDIPFLKVASAVAEANEDLERAIELSRDVLLLSKTSTEIDSALSLTTRLINKADAHDTILKELAAKPELGVAETCLIIELKDSLGDIKGADSSLEKLLKSQDTIALLQAARIYERRYQLDKAAESIEALTKLPGGTKTVFLKRLTQLYDRAGFPQKALDTVSRWKQIAANDKAAWLTEARLLDIQKGTEAAIPNLRKSTARFENDVEILGLLASLYQSSEQYNQASQIYWKLYDNADALSDRLNWASQLGKNAIAADESNELIDIFNSRRRKNPTSVIPIMALAEVYRELDQYEERRNLLLEATNLRPDDAQILIEIAAIDIREGHPDRAIEVLQKAEALDKKGIASKRLAKLYIEEGDFERGLDQLSKIQTNKDGARNIESVILPLLKQEAFEEARTYLDSKIADYADDWRLLILSSVIDYELGFNDKSFDTALAILSSTQDLGTLKDGWEMADLHNYNSIFEAKHLPSRVQQMLVAPQAALGLQNLTYTNNQHSYGFQQQARQSPLPKELEGAKLYATLQIIKLLEEVGEAQKENFTKRAEQVGLNSLPLWNEIINEQTNPRGNNQTPNYIVELAKKNPEDTEILMLYIALSIQSESHIIDDSLIEPIRKHFAPEKQIPAFSDLSVFLRGESEDPEQHLTKVYETLEKKDKIGTFDLIGVFFVNQDRFQMIFQGSVDIPDELAAVCQRYLDENPAVQQPTNFFQAGGRRQINAMLQAMAGEVVMQNLLSGDDYPRIIAAIEKDEVNSISLAFSNMFNYGMSNNGQLNLGEFTFPPTHLSHISPTQLNLFTSETSPLQAEGLKEHLDLFTNPLLKLLAAAKTGQHDLIPTLIEELRNTPKQEANSYYFEAAFALHNEEAKTEILKLLEEARNRTFDKHLRSEIDKNLISIALTIPLETQKQEGTKEAVAFAQAAARRMMISRNITHPEAISTLISGLGLDAEKGRFLTKNNTSIRSQRKPTGGFVSSSNSYRSNSSQAQPQSLEARVGKAVSQNDAKRASRLVSTELRALSRRSARSYEMNSVKQLIDEHKLKALVLKELHPNNSTSPRKWLAFYETANLLEDEPSKKEAVNYLSNLATIPSSVRAPLAFALFESDPERSMGLLKDSKRREIIFRELQSKLDENDSDPKRYNPVLEFAAEYLNSQDFDAKPLAQQEENEFNQFFREATRLYRVENSRDYLPQFWDAPAKKGTTAYEHATKRDAMLEPILIKALYVRSSYEDAFKMLHSHYTNHSKPLDPLTAYAKDSLARPAFRSASHFYSYSGSSNDQYQSAPSPLDHLCALAVREKNPDLLDEEWMQQCQSTAPTLPALKELLFLSNKEFQKALECKVEKNILAQIGLVDHAVELRGDKDRLAFSKIALPLYMDQLIEAKFQPTQFVDPQKFTLVQRSQESFLTSLRSLAASKNHQIIEETFNQLLAEIEKKKKPTPANWLSAVQQGYWSPGSQIEPLFMGAMMLRELVQNPQSANLGITLSEKHQCPIAHLMSDNMSYRFGGFKLQDPDVIYDGLEESGFLTDLSSIEFIKLTELDQEAAAKNNPQLKQYFNNLRNDDALPSYNVDLLVQHISSRRHYSDHQDAVKTLTDKLSKTKGEESFGAHLLAALIEKDRSTTVTFFKDYKDEILKAPPEKQAAVAAMFHVSTDQRLRRDMDSKGLKDLFPEDPEVAKERKEKALEAYFKLTPAEVTNDLYSLPTKTGDLIKQVLPTDPDLAAKIVFKYLDLVEGCGARAEQVFKPSTTLTTAKQVAFFNRLIHLQLGETEDLSDVARLIYRLDLSHEMKEINATRSFNYISVQSWLDKHKDVKNQKDREQLLKQQLKSLAQKIAKIKDPDEQTFIKIAWWNCLHRYGIFRNTPVATFRKIANQLKKEDPTNLHFYSIVELSYEFSPFRCGHYALGNWGDFANRNYAKRRLRMDNLGKRLTNDFKMASPYYAMVILNILEKNEGGQFINESTQLRQWYLSTLQQASLKPELSTSPHMQHVIQYLRRNLQNHQIDYESSFSITAERVLNSQIEALNKNSFIEKDSYIDAAIVLSMNSKGIQKLCNIIEKHPQHFEGNIDIAHILIQQNKLDHALLVLPDKENINPTGGEKTRYTAQSEKRLPTFLNLYANPEARLRIEISLLLSRDPDTISNSPNFTYPKRLVKAAQLLQQNKPNSTNPLYQEAYKTILNTQYTPALAEIPTYVKPEEIYDTIDILRQDALNHKNNYKLLPTLQAQLRVMLWEGKIDEYLKILQSITLEYNAFEKPKDKHRSILCYDYMMSITATSGYGVILDHYGNGETEKVTALLPVLREIARLEAYNCKVPEAPRKADRIESDLLPRSIILNRFLHTELDKMDEYEVWYAKLEPQAQERTKSPAPVHKSYTSVDSGIKVMGGSFKNRHFPGKELEQNSLITKLKITQSILSSDFVQKQTTSDFIHGGILNHNVAFRYYTSKHAIDIHKHLKLDGSPQFHAMLKRDQAIHYTNMREKENAYKAFEEMFAILDEHPLPKSTQMHEPYFDACKTYLFFGEAEKILNAFPPEIVENLPKPARKQYQGFMNRANKAQKAKAARKAKQ